VESGHYAVYERGRMASPIEIAGIERGVGCASVIPGAFIGLFGLADYAGPTGWRGASEFLGWGVVCFGVGIGIGLLPSQFRQAGRHHYAAIPLAILAAGAFTYLPYWLGLDAPMEAKVAFTTMLQIVGSLTPVALVAGAAFLGWRQRY
jgi:hypothetical protein